MKIRLCLWLILPLLGLTRGLADESDIALPGQQAPAFAGTATDGTAVTLAAFSGQVVLLDFFATWCGPCMTEMPQVETEIWQKHRAAGLVVLAIGREHSVEELAKFKAAKEFTFPIVADPHREIYARYAQQYIPRCYVIGKDGTIKYAAKGFEPEEFAKMQAVIAAELAK